MKGGDFERRAFFEWLPGKERLHPIALEIASLEGVPSEVLADTLNVLRGEDLVGKYGDRLRDWLIADSHKVREAASRLIERYMSYSRSFGTPLLDKILLKKLKVLLSDPNTRVGIAVVSLSEWNHNDLQAFAKDKNLDSAVRSAARARLPRNMWGDSL